MMGSRGAATPNPTKHKANARPTTPTDATRTANLNSANTVTKDFLVLSQPFMHAGLLIASASSGRRWYVHHLSEIPLSEVFLTKTGGGFLKRPPPKRDGQTHSATPHPKRTPFNT